MNTKKLQTLPYQFSSDLPYSQKAVPDEQESFKDNLNYFKNYPGSPRHL